MTRSIGRRARVVAVLFPIVAFATVAAFATPAGAATTNPCRVLRKADVQHTFGGSVTDGRKGFATRVSTQCEYQVGVNADRPAGTVVVHVTTTKARAAYRALAQGSRDEPIDGVADSRYDKTRSVVHILHGDVLVGVQGRFLITDPLPLHPYDAEAQLTTLAQIAAKRV